MADETRRPAARASADRANVETWEAVDATEYIYDWPRLQLPWRRFGALRQTQIDWLLSHGVTTYAMVRPLAIRLAQGHKSTVDGLFEDDTSGPDWLVFEEADDLVFWQPKTGELATWLGRTFALGEEVFRDAETFISDRPLKIFADPLQWLKAGRNGIVVIDWARAFETLQYVRRIEIDASLVQIYHQHMGPKGKPHVSIRSTEEAAA